MQHLLVEAQSAVFYNASQPPAEVLSQLQVRCSGAYMFAEVCSLLPEGNGDHAAMGQGFAGGL